MAKHAIWQIMAVVLLIDVVFGLAACSKTLPATPPEKVTITFACPDSYRAVYEQFTEAFHKANPSIVVRLISLEEVSGMQTESTQLSSSIVTKTITLTGNEGRNLASAVDTFVYLSSPYDIRAGYLLDLYPFVESTPAALEDFYPALLEYFVWQGGLWGLPAMANLNLIFYNKDLFDASGVSYPQVGWSWDDFLAAANRLTRHEQDKVVQYGFVDQWSSLTLEAFVYQHGARLLDEGTQPVSPRLDSPEVAEAVQWYVDLALVHGVMPNPATTDRGVLRVLANEGKAAMWTGWLYEYAYLNEKFNLGFAPYPDDVTAANPLSLYGYFVSAGTSHPYASWRWINFLTQQQWQSHSLTKTLPARRSVAEGSGLWTDREKEVYQYIIDHAKPWPGLVGGFGTILDMVLRDEASVEDALAIAQERATAKLRDLATREQSGPITVPTPRPTVEPEIAITFIPLLWVDQEYWRDMAEKFQSDYPDIYVEVKSVGLDTRLAGMEALAQAGDCFAAYGGIGEEEQKHILSLDPFLQADSSFDLNDFYPTVLTAFRRDGKLWGLPAGADVLLMYYNRNLFDQLGVAYPQLGWTMEDFLGRAEALTGGEGEDKYYGFMPRDGIYGDLSFFLEWFGATPAEIKEGRLVLRFHAPSVLEAMSRYADLARWCTPLDASMPNPCGGSRASAEHPAMVADGRVVMWTDFLSNNNSLPSLDFDWGVVPLPRGKKPVTEFVFWGYYISSSTADPLACWKWLTFLSQQENAVAGLPVRYSQAESRSVHDKVGEENLQAYLTSLQEYDNWLEAPYYWQPLFGYASCWLGEAFESVMTKEVSVQSALDQAVEKSKDYVACLEAQGGYSAEVATLRDCMRKVDPGIRLPGED